MYHRLDNLNATMHYSASLHCKDLCKDHKPLWTSVVIDCGTNQPTSAWPAVALCTGICMLSSRLRGGVAAIALLLFPDHVHELLKADIRVMRPWGSLRMILDGHCPLVCPHHAGACPIIQVDMGHLHTLRKGVGVYCVVVVLGTDLNPTCAVQSTLSVIVDRHGVLCGS